MKYIEQVIEELLAFYERTTPKIDQALVRRVLVAIRLCKSLAVIGLALFLMVRPVLAFDHRDNPDRYPSIGMDISEGHLPGILTDNMASAPATDGAFVKGLLDIRLPLTNALTLHAFGSSTGVNNNLQFSSGDEMGLGLRVYLQ